MGIRDADIGRFDGWTTGLGLVGRIPIAPWATDRAALTGLYGYFTRSNASKQLIFGGGSRLCLGHALARAEMTEALRIFAGRFPDTELGGDVEFTPSPTLLGPERLPLRLHK